MFKFDLLENETVTGLYRQSEAVLFKPVLIIFALIYLPWYFLLKYNLASSYPRLLLFYTILVFLYGLNTYFIWLANVYIVTNKRLVAVRYKSVVNKEVIESPIDKILNISFKIKGFWQSIFGFGSVEVQVAGAGTQEPIVLKNIAHPSEVKDFLWKTHLSKVHSPDIKTAKVSA